MLRENRILAALSPEVLQRLALHLDQVSLDRGKVVRNSGDSLSHLYFPIDCLISVTITMQDGATAEVGVVGSREVLGMNVLMGNDATTQTDYVVQIGGDALKIDVQIVREEFDRNGELRDVILLCMQTFLAQVSQTAACNALHPLEQRLSRWLLETQERIRSNNLPLTQEFLSTMLGVRRAGVTQTAQKLQERRLIQYHRGNVQILDQAGLEAAACECFRRVETEYDRLLGEQ